MSVLSSQYMKISDKGTSSFLVILLATLTFLALMFGAQYVVQKSREAERVPETEPKMEETQEESETELPDSQISPIVEEKTQPAKADASEKMPEKKSIDEASNTSLTPEALISSIRTLYLEPMQLLPDELLLEGNGYVPWLVEHIVQESDGRKNICLRNDSKIIGIGVNTWNQNGTYNNNIQASIDDSAVDSLNSKIGSYLKGLGFTQNTKNSGRVTDVLWNKSGTVAYEKGSLKCTLINDFVVGSDTKSLYRYFVACATYSPTDVEMFELIKPESIYLSAGLIDEKSDLYLSNFADYLLCTFYNVGNYYSGMVAGVDPISRVTNDEFAWFAHKKETGWDILTTEDRGFCELPQTQKFPPGFKLPDVCNY